jgi:hypothetical protein
MQSSPKHPTTNFSILYFGIPPIKPQGHTTLWSNSKDFIYATGYSSKEIEPKIINNQFKFTQDDTLK